MAKDPSGHHLSARDKAQADYFSMLARSGSPLLTAGEQVREQLIGQFQAIFDAAASDASDAMVGILSLTIGHARAAAAIHPAASLAAANMIFAASLPHLAFEFERQRLPEPMTRAAIRLNEAVLRRMAAAAEAYVAEIARHSGSGSRQRPMPRFRDASVVFTPRESEVLAAAATGSPNRVVAGELAISEATLKRHLATIYKKLGVRSRIQAVEQARAFGLLD